MNVRDYIVRETVRQSGTMDEAIGMFMAWQQFSVRWQNGYRLNGDFILKAARAINGLTAYRKTPAVFHQGTPAVSPGPQLERAMSRWNELINCSQVDAAARDSLFDTPREIADFVTLEFLLIHPFADGNGRVGSLVWNFLNETIRDPEPMPYFFGED